jgi:hypothetical protein
MGDPFISDPFISDLFISNPWGRPSPCAEDANAAADPSCLRSDLRETASMFIVVAFSFVL